MCRGHDRGSSGEVGVFADFETREIVIAEGVERHESDVDHLNGWMGRATRELEADLTCWNLTDTEMHRELGGHARRYGFVRRGRSAEEVGRRLKNLIHGYLFRSQFQYLEEELGQDFMVQDRQNAEYINHDQRVRYRLKVVYRKDEFKTELAQEGKIVIYKGHSRYGRGACFDDYSGHADGHGDEWENGRSGQTSRSGLFRLAYDYIAIPLEDMEHHQYTFAPIAVETDPPPRDRNHRHENLRSVRRFRRVTLEDPLRGRVLSQYRSPSHTYWGLRRERKIHLVLLAGWSGTQTSPYDLGGVEAMNCKTFCHFGCSSKKHFWPIVRSGDYYAGFPFERVRRPESKLAYFTKNPATWKTVFWIRHLLTCPYPNGPDHWYRTHEYAKRMANRQISSRRHRETFTIY